MKSRLFFEWIVRRKIVAQGRSDIKTTTIYAHLSNEHLQEAVERIDYGLDMMKMVPGNN